MTGVSRKQQQAKRFGGIIDMGVSQIWRAGDGGRKATLPIVGSDSGMR